MEFGNFSDESIKAFNEAVKEATGAEYDFARCVKPNGEVYGTSGHCRQGRREDKNIASIPRTGTKPIIPTSDDEEFVLRQLGSMIGKGEKILDSRKQVRTF
jgi:hypothetical protein